MTMTETRIARNAKQEGSRTSGGSTIPVSQAVVHRPIHPQTPTANTGRPRVGTRSTACHVCGRIGCPLISHRDYVFPSQRSHPNVHLPKSQGRGQAGTFRAPFLTEALHPYQMLEIRSGKFDPFVNLPIREQARDNDLFQHCKLHQFIVWALFG